VTPLHISVMTGDEAMVKLLHSFKASASIPDKVPCIISYLLDITARQPNSDFWPIIPEL